MSALRATREGGEAGAAVGAVEQSVWLENKVKALKC